MAKIPSRKFSTVKKKIPSKPFPKSIVKIPSRPFAKGTAKIASRQFPKATEPANKKHAAQPLLDRPTTEKGPSGSAGNLEEPIEVVAAREQL